LKEELIQAGVEQPKGALVTIKLFCCSADAAN
jgi:hypothetical protein